MNFFLIRPFYRTIEVIIVPDDQSFFKLYYAIPPPPMPSPPFTEYTLGPAFRKHFLYRVLDLQNNISSLTAKLDGTNQIIRLSDICLKPDNETCIILSLLQYYQNSRDNLDRNIGDGLFF